MERTKIGVRSVSSRWATSGLPQDFSDQLRANVSEDERTFLVDSQTIYDHYRRAFSLTKVLGT